MALLPIDPCIYIFEGIFFLSLESQEKVQKPEQGKEDLNRQNESK